MKLPGMLCVCKIQSLCVFENFVGQKGDMSNKNEPSVLGYMCRHVWYLKKFKWRNVSHKFQAKYCKFKQT